MSEEKPTLTVVAGSDGPTEGPHSNVVKIAKVKRQRGRPRKNDPVRDRVREIVQEEVAALEDIESTRSKAYAAMEPHLRDCVNMGRIADHLSDHPDSELYNFAVSHLADMLEKLQADYYAESFPV